MNTTPVLLLILLAAVSAAEGMDEEMEGVEQVTKLSELDGWWMIAVYKKGCSYCELLAPEWKALGVVVAEKYKGLHIGKADGDDVHIAGFDKGYPIILLMSADGSLKEFTEHNNRVLHRFLMFIEEHTPYQIDGAVTGMSNDIASKLTRIYYYWDTEASQASPATPLKDIVWLIDKGVITRHSLLALAGDTEWKSATEFDDLKAYFKRIPLEDEGKPTEGIYELTEADFKEKTTDGRVWLLSFYVPACGFCKKLKPEYEALAAEVTATHDTYAIGRVNCEKNPGLASQYSVHGYPTIFALKPSGERVDFTDHANRVKTRFLEFIGEVAGVAPKETTTDAAEGMYELTEADFKEKTTDGRVWLLSFYVPSCGFCKRLKPEYEALAAEVTATHGTYAIGRVNCEKNSGLASQYSVHGYPTIFALKPSGERIDFTDHPNRVKARFLSFLDEVSSAEEEEL